MKGVGAAVADGGVDGQQQAGRDRAVLFDLVPMAWLVIGHGVCSWLVKVAVVSVVSGVSPGVSLVPAVFGAALVRSNGVCGRKGHGARRPADNNNARVVGDSS